MSSASQYAPVATTGALVPVAQPVAAGGLAATGTAPAGAGGLATGTAAAGAPHGRDVLVTPEVDRQIEGASLQSWTAE